MYKIFNIIPKFIRRLRATLLYRAAVDMADRAHAATGQRYFVMPSGLYSGTLVVYDRNNFRRYRSKGYINRNMYIKDMYNDAYYYTPDKRETGPMSPKEQAYRLRLFLRWHERCHIVRRTSEKIKKAKIAAAKSNVPQPPAPTKGSAPQPPAPTRGNAPQPPAPTRGNAPQPPAPTNVGAA